MYRVSLLFIIISSVSRVIAIFKTSYIKMTTGYIKTKKLSTILIQDQTVESPQTKDELEKKKLKHYSF